MAYLKETHRAFTELAANNRQPFGFHLAGQIRTGRHGLYVGERPFNPGRDSVTHINHMSLKGEAMGVLHAKQVLPYKPLAVNIVVEHQPGDSDPAIERGKQLLAKSVKESIVRSKAIATDWMHSYLIGDMEQGITNFDVIDRRPKDNKQTLRTMADICSRGLGIVISDFENLDLSEARKRQFLGAVGLKFNYAYELALQPNTGVWTLRDGNEVDTSKPKQLTKHNQDSAERHKAIISGLQNAGMAVAQLVFDPDLYEPARANMPGFDIPATDMAIASTIRQAGKQ